MFQIIATNTATQRQVAVPIGKDPLVIGSAPNSALQLDGDGVEPDHCHVTLRADGTIKLVDQHTEAGTSVNGGYVAQKLLELGDRIEISGWVLIVAKRKGAAPAPAADPGARPTASQARQKTTERAAQPAAARPSQSARPANVAPNDAVQHDEADADELDYEEVATPPRPRYQSSGSGPLRGVLIAVVSVIAVGVVLEVAGTFGSSEALGGTTYEEDRLELASVLREGGRLQDARKTLEVLRVENGAVPGLDRALRQVSLAEDRERNALDQLASIVGDSRATIGQRTRRLTDLRDEYLDVASARMEIERGLADLRMEARLETHGGAAQGDELKDLSDAFLRTRNYASARGVWGRLSESELAVDQARMDAGVRAVDAAAAVEAGKMIARVDEMLANNDVLGALVVLDETEVRLFQGTEVFAELAKRGAEIDSMVAGAGRSLVSGPHAARTPKSRRGDAPDPAEESGPSEVETPATPTAPDRDRVSGSDRALADGDRRFTAGDLPGSIVAYEMALGAPGMSSGDRTQVTRRLERSNRAQWFLDALRNQIEANVDRVSSISIQDRSGAERGSVVGVSGEGLRLMPPTGSAAIGGEEIALSDVALDSVHRLARKFTFTPEDHLNRACYLMQGLGTPAEDKDAVDSALFKAFEDPSLKQPLDSAIAFSRSMVEIPEWGFFHYDGQWMTFREREQTENRIAVSVAVKQLDRSEKDEAKYAEALEELKGLIPVAREQVVQVLRERRAAMITELTTSSELPAIERVFETRRELEAKRDTALELIFDEVKYFYPYRVPDVPPEKATMYHKVQQEVDELVDAVRDVWGDEFSDFSGGVSTSSRFRSLMKRIDTEGALLIVADPDGFTPEPELATFRLLPLEAPRIHIRNIALTTEERSVLDRNIKVLAYNSTAQTSARSHEVDQLRITNDYRMMMGRSALAIHDKLTKSAWGHADWMSRTGKFGHFNDEDPKLRTPGDRIKAQGYVGGGSGENCAITGSAMGAHQGWTHSSGHHRNILYASHTELGVGGVGRYWVQNFAGGRAYQGNLGEFDDR